MLIRQCHESDYPYIKNLVSGFYDEAVSEWGFAMEESRLRELVSLLAPTSWVAEVDGRVVGLIAGQIVNQHLDSKPIWQEFVWYVDPDYRMCGIRLLKHVEKWCADNGIGKMIMVYLHNSKAEKLDEFYRREGYEPMETHFIKEL